MTTNTNQHTEIAESVTITHVDPGTLLVDQNVRHDAHLDKDFLGSIRDLGVLVPIVAVRTGDGSLRVRYGHRRTLAAVQAELAYVAVVVAADESADDAGEIERLLGQYAENQHRTGLSTGEQAEVFTQLSAFGVSASQIAKRAKVRRKEVDAALTVAGSELAKAAADRYDFLDLMQAAAVAEFEDDAEAVKELVMAARDGGFDHLLQRLRDDRHDTAEIARLTRELEEAGVRVIDRPAWADQPKSLDSLADDHGERLTAEGHAACPGHAAFVASQWAGLGDDTDHEEGYEFAASFVCTDPAGNGHVDPWAKRKATSTERNMEAEREQRRYVLANNKAWRSAESVRRDWLTVLLARKTAPKGTAAFVAGSLAACHYDMRKALEQSHPLVEKVMGCSTGTLAGLVDNMTDGRAQVVTLGMVLAAYEQGTGTHSWRDPGPATVRYFRHLAALGYELADVERLASGESWESIQTQDEAS